VPGLRKVRPCGGGRGDRYAFSSSNGRHAFWIACGRGKRCYSVLRKTRHGTLDRRHREDDQHDPAPGRSPLCFGHEERPMVPRAKRRSTRRVVPVVHPEGFFGRPKSSLLLDFRSSANGLRAAAQNPEVTDPKLMTVSTELEVQSFVLLRPGERRFCRFGEPDCRTGGPRAGCFAFLIERLNWKA